MVVFQVAQPPSGKLSPIEEIDTRKSEVDMADDKFDEEMFKRWGGRKHVKRKKERRRKQEKNNFYIIQIIQKNLLMFILTKIQMIR